MLWLLFSQRIRTAFNKSVWTALSRTAPHIYGYFTSSRTWSTDTIYNSNYVLLLLVQHILHYSLGSLFTYIRSATVGLESSRVMILILGLGFLFFMARFQKAVSTLIKCPRVEAKLIEICTERCWNQCLLPSKAWLDLGSFCGIPPPSGSLPPRVELLFPPSWCHITRRDRLYEWPACLETAIASPP